MLGRLADEDASKFSYENTLNTWFMLQDIMLCEHGAVPGFVFAVDMKGTSLAHAVKMHIATVKKYYMYIQVWSKGKGKAIPLQAWTGPKGFRWLRFPDFKTVGT
jgi:uncharacterized Fe-S cluster-containing MiaB family protein